MSGTGGIRLARLRDFLLIAGGSVSGLLAIVLFVLHGVKQTRNLVGLMFSGRTVTLAVALLLIAGACAVVYVFLAPPCHVPPDRRIRD